MTNEKEQKPVRRRLRMLIESRFNSSDISSLCFDLNEEYEYLNRENIQELSVSLISHFAKRGRMIDLLQYCIDNRPQDKQQFEEILNLIKDDPSLFPEFAPVNWADAPTETASQGLQNLVKLMDNPKVRNTIAGFHKDFQLTINKIDETRHFKYQHDLFQRLELLYESLHEERERHPNSPSLWHSMVINGQAVNKVILELLDSGDFYEQSQLQLLKFGSEKMEEALAKSKDLDDLDASLQFIYKSVRQGLPVANRRLVKAAKQLNMTSLVTTLHSVQSELKEQPEFENNETFLQFSSSIEELDKVETNLNYLVDHHDTWQIFYNELSYLDETASNLHLLDIKFSLPKLRKTSEVLFGESDDDWAIDLKRIGQSLEMTVDVPTPDQDAIVEHIRVYFNRATKQFREVDDELLEFCENLKMISDPLNSILKIIDE